MQWYKVLYVYESRMITVAIRCIHHPCMFSDIPLSILIKYQGNLAHISVQSNDKRGDTKGDYSLESNRHICLFQVHLYP